jgi:hypothetical protein
MRGAQIASLLVGPRPAGATATATARAATRRVDRGPAYIHADGSPVTGEEFRAARAVLGGAGDDDGRSLTDTVRAKFAEWDENHG